MDGTVRLGVPEGNHASPGLGSGHTLTSSGGRVPPEGRAVPTEPSVSAALGLVHCPRMQSDTTTTGPSRPAEEQRVILWRAEALVRAGYSAFAADVISVHREIDLHRAISLPQNGCPHDLALRILL